MPCVLGCVSGIIYAVMLSKLTIHGGILIGSTLFGLCMINMAPYGFMFFTSLAGGILGEAVYAIMGKNTFVTQDNFLFNCSLKENIRMGRPGAADREVFAAAKAAQCEEFVSRLEHGWDTPAGEAGKFLSGGEKQRIALARAILKDAPIVILDEATAFTDPQNENEIQQSILHLAKGKTLLVIAHRLSTIKNADQIIVLEKGKMIGNGKHQELLQNCPLYERLWKAHTGARQWAVSTGTEVESHA